MSPARQTQGRRHHAAVWRFHFYAGLVVIPFFVMAALTGLAIVLKTPADHLFHHDRLVVEAGEARLPATEIVSAVLARDPHRTVEAYIVPQGADRSVQLHTVMAHGGEEHTSHTPAGRVSFADPYTGEILGESELGGSLADWAQSVHGTLLMGEVGDVLLEIVAGFGILLLGTGLYLYWPAGRKTRPAPGRGLWRRLHGVTGVSVSFVLLFFLVSGLAWTPVWGGRLTQAWGAFPAERFAAPAGEARHAALNRPGARIIPWALETTPLPLPGQARPDATPVTLDDVVRFAQSEGFDGYRILLPRGALGVFTISATTMSGDIRDPRRDRTVHIDPASGAVLGDAAFAEYSLGGKAMAAGIALHQGNAGPVNILVNVLACLAVLAMSISGFAMWWARRPAGRRWAPAPLASPDTWRRVSLILLMISLLAPLTALVLAGILAIEAGIVRLGR
ncbi:PepSY domain-containing protein [Maricaulis sp.]|uniref:PepSY-associated TM helix domain-containing protein n=1 Tax=Maricaulis sp. TaxID=1486257 RepID=UPI001B237333|nr:PepSY domain-containing protein [Maricaulis sp.]MBO6765545.1 PepSY domain-containing protein [Maricaulis sp.]